MKLRWPVLVCLCGTLSVQAGDVAALQPAAGAVNALGCDLLTQAAGVADNALLSPYSIQAALAMTYAGAAGATREEMERVLHFGNDEDALHRSFAALQKALDDVARDTAARVARNKADGGGGDPVTLHVANRLFGQKASGEPAVLWDGVFGRDIAVTDVLGESAHPATGACLALLVGAGRVGQLGEITKALSEKSASGGGAVLATVRRAVALTADQSAKLEKALSSATGNEVTVKNVVDPSVIGGVLTQIGDEVIDGTIRSRLTQLRDAF